MVGVGTSAMVKVPLNDASVTPAMVMLWPIFKAWAVVVVIVTVLLAQLRDAPPAAIIAGCCVIVWVTDTFAGKACVALIGFETVIVYVACVGAVLTELGPLSVVFRTGT